MPSGHDGSPIYYFVREMSYTYDGKTYTYTEYEIATTSYNPEMAYQPIYAIYDNNLAHLFYRFLYHFEDAEPEVDSKGLAVVTLLNPARRTSYQFLGSWCLNTILTEYPAWKQRLEEQDEAAGYTTFPLNTDSYSDSSTEGSTTTYNFLGGIGISNATSIISPRNAERHDELRQLQLAELPFSRDAHQRQIGRAHV